MNTLEDILENNCKQMLKSGRLCKRKQYDVHGYCKYHWNRIKKALDSDGQPLECLENYKDASATKSQVPLDHDNTPAARSQVPLYHDNTPAARSQVPLDHDNISSSPKVSHPREIQVPSQAQSETNESLDDLDSYLEDCSDAIRCAFYAEYVIKCDEPGYDVCAHIKKIKSQLNACSDKTLEKFEKWEYKGPSTDRHISEFSIADGDIKASQFCNDEVYVEPNNYINIDLCADVDLDPIASVRMDVGADNFEDDIIVIDHGIRSTKDTNKETKVVIKTDTTFPKDSRTQDMKAHLEYLNSIPQYPQRSPEWYEQRKSKITASEMAACVVYDEYLQDLVAQNILHVPKKVKPGRYCHAYKTHKTYVLEKAGVRESKPPAFWFVHHGVKYEPIATSLYERLFNTTVIEYGLMPHRSLPFIAASPDGITTEGVMLEIKCPYSDRAIGPPSIGYWCQQQHQMKVCELDSNDFFDVRIREYTSREACYEDTDTKWKGVILQMQNQLLPSEKAYEYYYPDFNKSVVEQEKEIESYVFGLAQDRELALDYFFSRRTVAMLYWRVDAWSCHRIKFEQEWYDTVALPQIEATYNEIMAIVDNPNPHVAKETADKAKRAARKKTPSIKDFAFRLRSQCVLESSDSDA